VATTITIVSPRSFPGSCMCLPQLQVDGCVEVQTTYTATSITRMCIGCVGAGMTYFNHHARQYNFSWSWRTAEVMYRYLFTSVVWFAQKLQLFPTLRLCNHGQCRPLQNMGLWATEFCAGRGQQVPLRSGLAFKVMLFKLGE